MKEKFSHIPSRRRRRSICPCQPDATFQVVPSPPHSLEPEVEGTRPSGTSLCTETSSWGRRDVVAHASIRGFAVSRTAMKKSYEGRRHSPSRASPIGARPWPKSGSSLKSSRPPAFTRQTMLLCLPSLTLKEILTRPAPFDIRVRCEASRTSRTASDGPRRRLLSSFPCAAPTLRRWLSSDSFDKPVARLLRPEPIAATSIPP